MEPPFYIFLNIFFSFRWLINEKRRIMLTLQKVTLTDILLCAIHLRNMYVYSPLHRALTYFLLNIALKFPCLPVYVSAKESIPSTVSSVKLAVHRHPQSPLDKLHQTFKILGNLQKKSIFGNVSCKQDCFPGISH